MGEAARKPEPEHKPVKLAAKARHQLHRLPPGLRARAEEIIERLATDPASPTEDTGRMRVGVANRYGYHAPLDYHNRIYWTIDADSGAAYVWQIGGHLPLGVKNWS